jgi:8-oxo-dGTP pyrophosphatase MutT (NUDIX family)
MPLPHWLKPIREKVGHDLLLVPGVSAMIFNACGEVLLQRRSDNGQWGTIGGVPEPGEEPADAVVREVMEETGLDVVPEAITGVYSTPLIVYPNGDRVHYTITQFLCRPREPLAQPTVNDEESLELRFFPIDRLPADVRPDAAERIIHAAEASRGNGNKVRFRYRSEWVE